MHEENYFCNFLPERAEHMCSCFWRRARRPTRRLKGIIWERFSRTYPSDKICLYWNRKWTRWAAFCVYMTMSFSQRQLLPKNLDRSSPAWFKTGRKKYIVGAHLQRAGSSHPIQHVSNFCPWPSQRRVYFNRSRVRRLWEQKFLGRSFNPIVF